MKEPECIRFSILNFLQSIDLSARFHPGRRWLFVGEHNRNWDAQLHDLWPHKIQARVTAQPCNWSERNGEKLFSMCNCNRSRRRTPGWYFLHFMCIYHVLGLAIKNSIEPCRVNMVVVRIRMLVFAAVTGESIEHWRLCETRRRVGMDKDFLAWKCCRRDHYYYTENWQTE